MMDKIADQIERQGPEHDRSVPGRGLPDNCIAVFRGGNITNYLPILKQGGQKPEPKTEVYQIGDVVRLRSGGSPMTVTRYSAMQDFYSCMYFNDRNELCVADGIPRHALRRH